MTRWKYKVAVAKVSIWNMKEQPGIDAVEETLTRLGMEGWELINALPSTMTGNIHLYLKRPY